MTIEEILSSTGETKEVIVEINSIKRSDYSLKTWYFSTQLRETGSTDVPPNTTMPGYLEGGILGPLTQALSEDLFTGLASIQPGNLKIIQSDVDPDDLSQLNDYIFAGQQVKVKVGLDSFTLYSDFQTYRTFTVSVDPSVELTSNGLEATFPLASATDRLLKENLITDRYRGIPHCVHFLTSLSAISRAHNSLHSLPRFTAMVTFRTPSSAAGNTALFRKQVSATNCNWSIRVLTNGHVSVLSSTATATDISIETADSYADDQWHTAIFARDDSRTAYFILDNDIIAIVTPTGSTDLPASAIEIGSYAGTDRHVSDVRLYPRYMTPSEARLKASQRADGSETVALWRCDDNAGSTINDYSPNNLDASISGTINTDWKWDLTDFGEPELAGGPYPIMVGEVFNAKAQKTDVQRNRYRINVDFTDTGLVPVMSASSDLVVKSQGTILTGGGVDYDIPTDGGDGVFFTVNTEGEPVTFDITKKTANTSDAWLANVGYQLISHRTNGIGVDTNQITRLGVLCPWKSGWRTETDTNVAKALEDIYGSSGLAYFEGPSGDIFVEMLRPPYGYGPFGHPMVDFSGRASLDFGDIADISGSCTLACWFITSTVNQSATYIPGSEFMMISKPAIGTTNYALYLITSGSDAGKIAFKIGGQVLLSPAGLVEPNVLYLVAGIFNDSANTMTINLTRTHEAPPHPPGGLLWEVASATNSNSPTVNSSSLFIGGDNSSNTFTWGSIQFAQIWNTSNTLTSLQLQATRTSFPVGNESGLVFYAPGTEGQGPVIDLVSTAEADLFAPQRWSPKFTVNLEETPSVKLTEFHHTDPAGEVIIQYSRNWFPMNQSDIDSGVSENSALALKTDWKRVSAEDPVIEDNYHRHKKISLPTALTTQEGAEKLFLVVSNRFKEGRWIGKLTFPPGLDISSRACSLQIGDEIGIISPTPTQLEDGLSFRVIAVSPNLLNLSTTVIFWG